METRAYSIDANDIAAEWSRIGDDQSGFDASRVLKLDRLELRPLGPDDVRMRLLAFSLEHNLDHAVLADTVNIAELRGGKIFPGNSAVGEVVEVGGQVTRFAPGDVVITTASERRIATAIHCASGPTTSRIRSVGTVSRRWLGSGSCCRRHWTAASVCGRSPRCRCERRPPTCSGGAATTCFESRSGGSASLN